MPNVSDFPLQRVVSQKITINLSSSEKTILIFLFFLPLKQMIKNRCFCILLKVSQRILSLGKLFYNRKKAGTLILRD